MKLTSPCNLRPFYILSPLYLLSQYHSNAANDTNVFFTSFFLLHISYAAHSSYYMSQERVSDEMSLRRAIMEACENRAVNTLPLGGSVDTSSAVWEIELRQNEKGTSLQDPLNSFRSRLIVVDVAAVDALLQDTSLSLSSNGSTLHRSVCTFEDVVKKLSVPATSSLAPFRGSKLTHYLRCPPPLSSFLSSISDYFLELSAH